MDLLASYSDENSKQSPSNIPLPNEKYDTKLQKGTSLEEEWASFAKLIDGENMSEPMTSSTNEKVAVAKRTFSESGTSQSYAYEIQSSSSSCSSRSNSVEPEKRSSTDKTENLPLEEEPVLPAHYRPRKDSGKGSSTSRSRSPSRSPSQSPKRQKRGSKDKRSRSRSKGRRKKSRSISRDKKSRSRSRDRHRKSKKEKRRHRSSSRSRKSRSRSRKRSTSRHRSPHSRRSRSRSRDRKRTRDRKSSRERNRHRSKDRSHRRRKQSKSRRRSRSRSRSRSPRRHNSRSPRHHSRSRSRSYSPRSSKMSSVDSYQKKISGTFMKKSKPLTFREKMRQDLLKASKMLTEQGENEKEKSGNLPLAVSTESTSVTPQMALLQTMAVMHQKAQEMTGVTVPKYYNPAAVNPLKYAEQYQKRKLLWSKNKEKKEDGAEHWQATAFQADTDGKTTAKFRKLMGMKEEAPVSDDALTEEQRAKREELFNRLDKDYEFARMSTHTHRGVGLGFASQGMSMPQFPQP